MGRETARKLATDPDMVHTEVVRGFNGDVSMDSANSFTASFASVTTTESAVKIDDFVAFTSAVLQVTSTAGSPSQATLTAQGNTITQITGGITANSTSSTSQNTWTTVLRQPTFNVNAQGGTITGNVTVTRENRL